jgi:hypothetical protein
METFRTIANLVGWLFFLVVIVIILIKLWKDKRKPSGWGGEGE